jgi:DNA-directed RNA polymerase subunit K/omega
MDDILDSEMDVYEDNDTEYDIMTININENKGVDDIISFMKDYETNKKNYKTSPVLSKYEKTRVLSERTQQIEDGSPPNIPNVERFNSSYSIALEEFNKQKIPFIIRRGLSYSNSYEYWKLKDMIN